MANNTLIAGVANPSATANQLQSYIVNQFNGTTYAPNSLDVQHEPLYDVNWNPATNAPWAAGATLTPGPQTQFFTTGQTTGKSIAQTNVTSPKKLDAPQAFAVMGIGYYYAPNTLLADIILVQYNFDLEFWIGEKSYNRAPVFFYDNGGGVTGFSNQSAAVALTNGRPGRDSRHTLAVNIIIDNQASFYGLMNGNAITLTASGSGGTGLTQMLILDGLHARGVQ